MEKNVELQNNESRNIEFKQFWKYKHILNGLVHLKDISKQNTRYLRHYGRYKLYVRKDKENLEVITDKYAITPQFRRKNSLWVEFYFDTGKAIWRSYFNSSKDN